MSDRNRALAIRWFEEIWNQRRTETLDELMAPNATGYMEGKEIHGPEDFKAMRAALLGAFPDIRLVVEDTVADGDHVVVRWRAIGTHGGDQLGFRASQLPVNFRGMTWMTFADSRVIKGWDSWNQGALFQTLQAASAQK